MGSVGLNVSSAAQSGTGIDVQGMVDQVLYAERAPERDLQTQQALIQSQNSALAAINANLSDLRTSLQSLTDISGQFNGKAASSSNANLLTAGATAYAQAGSHTVTVTSLAATGTSYTDPLTDSKTTFTAGSFDLRLGTGTPVTITVDSTDNTLDGIVSAINAKAVGVTASVITDANGARLSLVANQSGAAGDLTITNDSTGLTFHKGITGVNADLTVDGVQISSASNTVAGAIPGVTLNLVSADPNSSVSLNVKADTDQANAAVDAFVSAYNKAIQSITAQFNYDPNSGTAPPLLSDSTLRLVQEQLLGAVSHTTSGSGGISSLYDLGITVNNDGTLTADHSQLDNALSSQYGDVQKFLQTASTGFAQNFNSVMEGLTDSVNGPLNVELTGNNQLIKDITNHIADIEARMQNRQQELLNEYSTIDATLRQLPLLVQQINSQLSSINS
jgi:flagellar hook-associated protein 2